MHMHMHIHIHTHTVPPETAVHLASGAHLTICHSVEADSWKLCVVSDEDEEHLV